MGSRLVTIRSEPSRPVLCMPGLPRRKEAYLFPQVSVRSPRGATGAVSVARRQCRTGFTFRGVVSFLPRNDQPDRETTPANRRDSSCNSWLIKVRKTVRRRFGVFAQARGDGPPDSDAEDC